MTTPGRALLKLLVIEDDPRDAELIVSTLEADGFQVDHVRVDTREALEAELTGGRLLDLILADYVLPSFEGNEALSVARRLRPDLPFIMISGKVGEDIAIDMLHAGATDYVLKQRMARLAPAVKRAVREKEIEEERQRALNALQDVRARLEETSLLQQVVEQSTAGIILAEAPSGRILVLNRSAEWILDLDRPTLATVADIARSEVYKPDGTRAGLDELPTHRALIQGEVIRDTLLEFRHRDGRSVFALISSTPVRDPAGNVLAVVSSYTDITERKNSEEALREADRQKNTFLGVLSHELRNPLAPIRNSIHILNHVPPDSDSAARARAVIARQTNQLARLIDDLLDVTRIARGKIRLHRNPVELNGLARDCVDDHRPIFDARDIKIRMRVDAGPQWIDGDATRITQVIGNLLHNAAKFTNAHGHVLVTIERKSPSEVMLRVADDGMGIAPELLGNIFEPFTQSDASLHRPFGGLGLGLALVKGLVGMHDGRVEAHSPGPGAGSEFTIVLPLLREVQLPQETDDTFATTGQLRLLVVEDNLDAAETFKDVLEMSGHEVFIAHDGQEGIDKARSLNPDVVLCDIGLPGIDGYEVARRIRAEGAAAGARLIAVSGYASPEDTERAIRAGFDFHLAKPPDTQRILRLVAEAAAARQTTLPRGLTTGHHELDAHHASILSEAGKLRAGVETGAVWESLRFLERHAVADFDYEEEVMEDVRYPGLASHQKEHREFLNELRRLHEQVRGDGPTPENVAAVAEAVEGWLPNHVVNEDRRFAEFIHGQALGSRGSARSPNRGRTEP